MKKYIQECVAFKSMFYFYTDMSININEHVYTYVMDKIHENTAKVLWDDVFGITYHPITDVLNNELRLHYNELHIY